MCTWIFLVSSYVYVIARFFTLVTLECQSTTFPLNIYDTWSRKYSAGSKLRSRCVKNRTQKHSEADLLLTCSLPSAHTLTCHLHYTSQGAGRHTLLCFPLSSLPTSFSPLCLLSAVGDDMHLLFQLFTCLVSGLLPYLKARPVTLTTLSLSFPLFLQAVSLPRWVRPHNHSIREIAHHNHTALVCSQKLMALSQLVRVNTYLLRAVIT